MIRNLPKPSDTVLYNDEGIVVPAKVYNRADETAGWLNLLILDKKKRLYTKLIENVPYGNLPGTWRNSTFELSE